MTKWPHGVIRGYSLAITACAASLLCYLAIAALWFLLTREWLSLGWFFGLWALSVIPMSVIAWREHWNRPWGGQDSERLPWQ